MDEILDDDLQWNIGSIPDRTLLEITDCNSYPLIFIQRAKEELNRRNVLTIDSPISKRKEVIERNIYDWVNKNPTLSILAFLAGIGSGFVGFGVVMISVYQSGIVDADSRSKVWVKMSKVLMLLIVLLLIGRALLLK